MKKLIELAEKALEKALTDLAGTKDDIFTISSAICAMDRLRSLKRNEKNRPSDTEADKAD
jgi:predicted dinucleotide-utilizing enzyme